MFSLAHRGSRTDLRLSIRTTHTLLPHLAAAEYVTGRGLDVEVSEDADRLVFGLLRTVEGQTATLADLGAQLRGEQRNKALLHRRTHTHEPVDVMR